MNDILLIDPRQSGISGDMLLSALTDFFDCQEFTNKLLKDLCSAADSLFSIKCTYKVEKTTKNHFHGSNLNFSIDVDFQSLNVQKFKEHWIKILDSLKTSKIVQNNIFRYLNKIIETEKQVHGMVNASLEDLHFHELNSIDTIIDMTTIAYILEKYDFPRFYGLPTAIGIGPITFSHGTFQQPAPAVARLLEETSYPFHTLDAKFELTTPTGMSNLTSIVKPANVLQTFPSGSILRSGIGLGQNQIKGFPNYLKIWKISVQELKISNLKDSLFVLETHLDDVSGEVLGMVINTYGKLEGVKDVSIYPLIMKKNRPGHCLRILLDPALAEIDEISKKIMKDTGTLGIRYYPVSRHKTVREIIEHKIFFNEQKFSVRIKISKLDDGQIVNIKPEYDDLIVISKKLNCSVREISQTIVESFKKEFKVT